MLKLYNSLYRKKEEFKPLNPPFVGVYVCGPTVYGDSHLGHAKSYISFDVLIRYLRFLNFRVRYVQNITDVGHLTDNADQGEDKIQKQARLEKIEPMEMVENYIRSYFEDMDALDVLRPDISPRASGHITEQIELVKKLLEKGYAYGTDRGNVYFSVLSFPDYGKLSGRKIDELFSGVRVDAKSDKRDIRDFALWKNAEEEHLMKWNSPWGWGYPGWHLECSAMSNRYLGETIDIHGGGLENIFPHHESEIAQSESVNKKQFARFWMHNNMVTVDGRKMGKSLGNFITLKEIFQKYDPLVVRLYVLRSHYRSPLDFSDDGLFSARSGLERLQSFRSRSGETETDFEISPSTEMSACIEEMRNIFFTAMDDDLNTPGALAAIFDFVRKCNTILDKIDLKDDKAAASRVLDELAGEILGLNLSGAGSEKHDILDIFRILSSVREVLRKNRLFEEADAMRRQLEESGCLVKDQPDGKSIISRK